MKDPDCPSCPLYEQCKEKLGERSAPGCASELKARVAEREMEERVSADENRKKEIAILEYDKVRMKIVSFLIVSGILLLLSLIAAGMIGCPRYNVYSQKMEGRAILAHAQSSREVAVAEAKAKMESAALLAAADTLRAQGVARSNIIIGQSLTDSYLRWFWISELKPGGQVIYVPTEANLPILEAAKRGVK
jgi:hypothetical protein